LLCPGAADAEDQPRARWWLDPGVQRELALTEGQVQALQRTFERDLPARRALRRELNRLDSKLQQLLERAVDDDNVIERFSARVEQVRAKRNVRRTLILLEMYKVLTPAQRVALSRLQTSGIGPAVPPTLPGERRE
jgi:Spy/CpxP family protein refolding chaperone